MILVIHESTTTMVLVLALCILIRYTHEGHGPPMRPPNPRVNSLIQSAPPTIRQGLDNHLTRAPVGTNLLESRHATSSSPPPLSSPGQGLGPRPTTWLAINVIVSKGVDRVVRRIMPCLTR